MLKVTCANYLTVYLQPCSFSQLDCAPNNTRRWNHGKNNKHINSSQFKFFLPFFPALFVSTFIINIDIESRGTVNKLS